MMMRHSSTFFAACLAAACALAQPLPELKLMEPTVAPGAAPNVAPNVTANVVTRAVTSAAQSSNEPTTALRVTAFIASIEAPSVAQFSRLCQRTADPADCGKKIEASQLAHAAAAQIARRDGALLAIAVPGEPPFIFEDIDSEAGPNVSFYAYSSGADSVVLYRARGDKIDFLMLHRPTGNVTELPNEPKFNRDGRYFATADFCKEGCENRIAVWRIERRGALRERVYSPRTPWDDADVSWGGPTRLVVDVTENGKSTAINLDVNDSRWTVLAP
jgi:hypothetical protein